MKKVLLVCVIAVAFTVPLFADGFQSVHSPNGFDVWAVGNNGLVFRSFDAGVTWSTYTFGTETLRSVYTAGSQVWIVGDSGACHISTDGGTTWSEHILAAGTRLTSVFLSNTQTGWAVGAGGTILKTSDGGSTWVPKASNTLNDLNAITFVDSLVGYVGGSAGTLLKTSDGGDVWTDIAPLGWTRDILSLSAAGPTVYVSGTDEFCYVSTNVGTDWTELNFKTDTHSDVNAVYAISPTTVCFVGGGGFIRMSPDGGASFNFGMHQMYAKLNTVFFFNPTMGWAASEKNNAVLRTTDGGVTWSLPQGATINYQWQQKFSAGSIGNTFCVNPWNKNIIYVVMGSTIYISGDRGETWSSTGRSITGGGSTWSFYVSPRDTNIWVAATSGGGKGVRRSTDRGVTWTTTLVRNFTSYGMPLERDPESLDTLVFAEEKPSTANAVLYLSKDFGATWDTLVQTNFRSPCDVVIIPGNRNLWYVGDGVTGSGAAQMWRSTDYGKTWTSIYSSPSSEIPMIAVSRLRNAVAFATAWSNTSYRKTTNGGLSWTDVASTTSTWGTDIAKDDPNVVIYGVYGGSTSYLSMDAGSSFHAVPLSGSNSGMIAYDRATFVAHQAGNGVWKYNITYTVPTSNVQTIVLTAPSGGENWAYNTVHSITWSAANMANVKIEYKTSPAGPWQLIAASVPGSLGSYDWTVPNTPTTQARVRISDALDAAPFDSSHADFSLTVANISTNRDSLGFGNIGIGRDVSDTIRITNAGSGTLVVSSAMTGTSTFTPGRTSFTIPAGGSDTLSVSFSPTALQEYVDTLVIVSNGVEGPVSIPLSGTGVEVASVAVLAPNGGEVWQAGTSHDITWTSMLVSDIDLWYRMTAQKEWFPIAANVPAASGAFSWNVPNTPGQAIVRVAASSDSTVLDESDSSFVIEPATSVGIGGSKPTMYELGQNYPNPFNPSTRIAYALPFESHVTLTVYNTLGQEIVRLVDEDQRVGRYAVQFSASSGRGAGLSSGLYYYRLQARQLSDTQTESFVQVRSMLLLK